VVAKSDPQAQRMVAELRGQLAEIRTALGASSHDEAIAIITTLVADVAALKAAVPAAGAP